MDAEVLGILLLTLRIATVATGLVLIPAMGLAYALARFDFRGKRVLSALVGLPLVLPPTAVGFLLLRLLATQGPLGRQTLGIDLGILLTWKAAVLAAGAMSLPLVVRAMRIAFEGVDPQLEMIGRTLGYGRLESFRRITLPLAARGLLGATLLGFTRALGEFGATVTLAGNIPGRTQTLASAIFSAQQVGDHARGDFLMVLALVLGFTAILTAETLAGGRRRSGSG